MDYWLCSNQEGSLAIPYRDGDHEGLIEALTGFDGDDITLVGENEARKAAPDSPCFVDGDSFVDASTCSFGGSE